MKFSCLQGNLSLGLNINCRIAGISKTGLPILNNILLTAEKGNLKLSTTNLEMAIETKIRAKVEKEGKTTIPAQLLVNYIDLLPDEALKFETAKEELTIRSKNQETRIKGISAEEFPIIPHIERKERYVLDGRTLKDALEKTIFTISPSETRAEISGVLFQFNMPQTDSLTIVGTDSYRLAEKEIPFKKAVTKEKKNVIIPVKVLGELLKIIKDEKEIELYLSENQILFVYQNTEIISRMISGEYPDYKQIIPSSSNTRALINKGELLRTVRAASFFTKSGINDIRLKLLSQKNKLQVLSLNSQIGENKSMLEAEISGEDNEIVFNYRYLIDGLMNIPGEEVSLEIVNDNTPGLIKSTSDPSYLYLIMPIKDS